jgi:hypothetical protein
VPWREAIEQHQNAVRGWPRPQTAYASGLALWVGRRSGLRDEAIRTGILPPQPTEAERRAAAAAIAREQRGLLKAADTWAVTPDMVRLVAHAAHSMPSETVDRSDIPSPNGFVWLAAPSGIEADDGVTIPYSAVHWYVDEAAQLVRCVVYRQETDTTPKEEQLSADELAFLGPLYAWSEWDWAFDQQAWATHEESAIPRFVKALWTISSASRRRRGPTSGPPGQAARGARGATGRHRPRCHPPAPRGGLRTARRRDPGRLVAPVDRQRALAQPVPVRHALAPAAVDRCARERPGRQAARGQDDGPERRPLSWRLRRPLPDRHPEDRRTGPRRPPGHHP